MFTSSSVITSAAFGMSPLPSFLGLGLGKTCLNHILDVKNKANKTLGCIKRNLH